MERRKYPRLDMDLPMAYQIHSPDLDKSSAGMGALKNISQGGMFFKCPPPLPIDDGDIRDFTLDTIPIMRQISRLKALGKVVRIEPPEENSFDCGIAVQFLSDLKVEFRR
ncbi:MAG: PilZ domain-containing protein [Deltaproteobacteria bacterium]|nr:PilZ domain-containing protein [Deltaproteobacteria bacterium]